MEDYIFKLINRIYGILSFLCFITYIISFILIINFINFNISKSISTIKLNLLYFYSIKIPIEINLWQLLIIIYVIFIICFLISYFSYEKYPIIKLIKEGILSERNFLINMPLFSSFTFIIILLIHKFEETIGVGIGGPVYTDPLISLLSLSYAVISEEIGFRLIPILIPIGIYLLLKRYTNNFIIAIFKPGFYNVKDKWLNIIKIFLIILSSFIFSYAHLISNIWEIGKFPSTFFAGIIIGYCAVKYGFDAAILMHWYFNYYWFVIENSIFYEFSFILTIYTALFSIIYFPIKFFKIKNR
ncbi:MAG: CPBP family intramembrane metalloprotease [Candidatus Verstraetearchaeota archaeon]|nr:CPBP family intramembrane metalloprotease [Candidatus Verstraetearchaeota archaeon]